MGASGGCVRCVHLGEVHGEYGVRAAAGFVHSRAGRGAVGVSRGHQLPHVAVAVHDVPEQVWTRGQDTAGHNNHTSSTAVNRRYISAKN